MSLAFGFTGRVPGVPAFCYNCLVLDWTSSTIQLIITADRAYVVVPANYTFKKNGKLVKETGSMFTFALQKGEAGWRITGWAWAKH